MLSRTTEDLVLLGRELGARRRATSMPYGARLLVKDGCQGRGRATSLAEWDPHTLPIITETSQGRGEAVFHDLVEGIVLPRSASTNDRHRQQGGDRLASAVPRRRPAPAHRS